MLGECADTAPAHETADHSYFACVTVKGIDQFYTEVLGNGASLMQGLADKPWGMREFGVRTPDGHRIMFGQELWAARGRTTARTRPPTRRLSSNLILRG